MASAARVFADFKPVEDLTLNGRPKTLDVFQPVLADGGFERVQIGEAELPVQNIDLFRLEPRNGEHVEHALRHLPAQLLQQGVGAGVVQLGDDVGDRLADPGKLA